MMICKGIEMDFSKARTPLDVLDLMSAPKDDTLNILSTPLRAFADGVRAGSAEANLCRRKLRVAIQHLEAIAVIARANDPNLASASEKAMRDTAQIALDRIGELK